MFKLLINNEESELKESSRLVLNRIILNVNDISDRGIAFSNMITLPSSSKNLRLTGFPNRLSFNNLAFERTKPYQIVYQNTIVSEGDLIVKSYSEKDGIKIQMAEGFNFWQSIGSKKLRDLDLFSDYLEFSAATYNTISTKTGSVWLWSFIRAFDDTVTGDPPGDQLTSRVYSRPSYRVKTLLDNIVSQSGFDIEYNNTLNSTELDDFGFLSNTRDFAVTDNRRIYENVTIPSGLLNLNSASVEFSLAGNTQIVGLTNLENNLYKTSLVLKGTFSALNAGFITITTISGAETLIETIGYNQGPNFINYQTNEFEIDSTTTVLFSTDVNAECFRVIAHINESAIVEVEGDWVGGGGGPPDERSILNDFEMMADYNLPNITQLDLFKAIVKMFFLKVDTDNLKKMIELDSFADVLTINNSIDVSNKLRRFPSVSTGDFFGQLNVMRYSNDDDVNESLGEANFNIDNDSIQREKLFMEIPQFSASNQALIEDNTTITVFIYTENGRTSVKDRICDFGTGVGVPFSCRFSLSTMQSMFTKYYSSFVNSVRRERIMNIDVLLNRIDFNRINKSPIIYIKDLKSYFLVLSISNFEPGKFSSLKVVKYG